MPGGVDNRKQQAINNLSLFISASIFHLFASHGDITSQYRPRSLNYDEIKNIADMVKESLKELGQDSADSYVSKLKEKAIAKLDPLLTQIERKSSALFYTAKLKQVRELEQEGQIVFIGETLEVKTKNIFQRIFNYSRRPYEQTCQLLTIIFKEIAEKPNRKEKYHLPGPREEVFCTIVSLPKEALQEIDVSSLTPVQKKILFDYLYELYQEKRPELRTDQEVSFKRLMIGILWDDHNLGRSVNAYSVSDDRINQVFQSVEIIQNLQPVRRLKLGLILVNFLSFVAPRSKHVVDAFHGLLINIPTDLKNVAFIDGIISGFTSFISEQSTEVKSKCLSEEVIQSVPSIFLTIARGLSNQLKQESKKIAKVLKISMQIALNSELNLEQKLDFTQHQSTILANHAETILKRPLFLNFLVSIWMNQDVNNLTQDSLHTSFTLLEQLPQDDKTQSKSYQKLYRKDLSEKICIFCGFFQVMQQLQNESSLKELSDEKKQAITKSVFEFFINRDNITSITDEQLNLLSESVCSCMNQYSEELHFGENFHQALLDSNQAPFNEIGHLLNQRMLALSESSLGQEDVSSTSPGSSAAESNPDE